MIQIPENHQYVQSNIGDVQPNIFISKNLDLTDNYGKIRIGKRLVVNTSSTNSPVSMNNCPVAFVEWSQGTALAPAIFSIAGLNFIEQVTDYPGGTGFGIVSGSVSTYSSDNSDLKIFQNNLYGSGQTTLEKYAYNGALSEVDTTFSSLGSHLMEVYSGNVLYIQDTFSLITAWNGSSLARSGANTIDFSTVSPVGGVASNSTITGIRAATNIIWVSTMNQSGGRGYVYQWDGASNSPTKEFKLESAGAMAMIIKDDVPWIMDVYGRLLAWNGGTFEVKAQLNRRVNQLFYNSLSPLNNRWIHPNGMSIINNRLNILIDGRHYNAAGSIEETIPSGIYEYDDNIGLSHKHSFGLSYSGDTIIDYGSNRIARAGALAELNYPDLSTSRNGTFLAGANYYIDATTVAKAVFYDDSNDTLQKSGYIVTNKIEATDGSPYNLPVVEANWQSFFTVYKTLLNQSDKIIPKYRTTELTPVEGTISWIDTRTFKVPNSSVIVSNYWTHGTGGEVEIMQGLGAGKCAHITSATLGNDGNWVVGVDESFVGATGTAQARFANWIKISEISPVNNNVNFNSDTIGQKSTWIQFKVCMLFTGRDEIERFLISNVTATPVK